MSNYYCILSEMNDTYAGLYGVFPYNEYYSRTAKRVFYGRRLKVKLPPVNVVESDKPVTDHSDLIQTQQEQDYSIPIEVVVLGNGSKMKKKTAKECLIKMAVKGTRNLDPKDPNVSTMIKKHVDLMWSLDKAQYKLFNDTLEYYVDNRNLIRYTQSVYWKGLSDARRELLFEALHKRSLAM